MQRLKITTSTIRKNSSAKMLKTIGLIALSAFFVFAIADDSTSENPIVEAPIGKIRGSILTSRLGRKIYSFRSVRYAEPPVGQQRFQVAVPAKDWSETYDATEEGPACSTLSKTPISEDCLRLNVYTTKLPSKNAKGGHFKGRPVLVFFHPGGFYIFSGQYRFFGPEYIMDQDIVLVTLNYRLGTLGFISTGDSLAPGNLGLKDQVVALRWIQRNIAAFGGDPNSVTIGGYSVGSIAVLLHMLSPMSKGLFHRAIAMSGSHISLEPLPTEQKHLAKKQAELLDCPTDTTGSMLICLKSKRIEQFTETMPQFFEWYGDPILIWSAVVEPEIQGVERFLTAQPVDLIREGKMHEVPLIIGITEGEFGGVVTGIERLVKAGNTSIFDALNTRWNTIAPISFMYERDTPRSKHISQELRQFYFGNQSISQETYDGISHIYADSVIIFPVHRAAQLIASNSKLPVYFYKFSYKGHFSFATWNDTTPYGPPVHHDDLQYLFYMSAIFPYFNASDPEIQMVERYTAMWTNFIQTGEPIPNNDKMFSDVKWERFTKENDKYLNIDLHPTMKQGIFSERMALWEHLFPLPPPSHSINYQKSQ
ncbi:esterase E4-like [Vespula squamosa]|uniref:Esterase E4-like n=1 Tax=Vespula squamosa TaxID=30214 RepID=A0ABD2AIA3_VESSQ